MQGLELHFGADSAELRSEPLRLVFVRFLTDANRLLHDGVIHLIRRTARPAGDLMGDSRSSLRIFALLNKDFILHNILSIPFHDCEVHVIITGFAAGVHDLEKNVEVDILVKLNDYLTLNGVKRPDFNHLLFGGHSGL